MTSYDSEDGYDQNRNFFKVHRKLLHLSSILPKSGKSDFHNILSIVTLIWCIPPLISLLYAICENWGDVSVVTGMVFQVSFVVNCTAVYIYLILNRKSLRTILSRAEESFTWCINNLALDRMSLYGTLMTGVYRQNTILTRTVTTINFTAYLFWTIFPFILWCIDSINDSQNMDISDESQNYNTGQWKYFCYRMWLPQNATQTPLYQIIYAYQALENSMVILIHTAHNLITFSLILHLTSQFQALTTFLEKMADTPLTVKQMAASIQEVSDDRPCDNATQNSHERNDENVTKRNTISLGCTRLYKMLLSRQDNGWPQMDREMLPTPKDDELCSYLVNCVRYHQFLLQ